jgi:hypothetical protein
MISDDGGSTWRLGGGWADGVNFPNENQLVELVNRSDGTNFLWSNSRGALTARVSSVSVDAGETWGPPEAVPGLVQV